MKASLVLLFSSARCSLAAVERRPPGLSNTRPIGQKQSDGLVAILYLNERQSINSKKNYELLRDLPLPITNWNSQVQSQYCWLLGAENCNFRARRKSQLGVSHELLLEQKIIMGGWGGGGEGGGGRQIIPVFSLQAKRGAPTTGPRLRPMAHSAWP